MLIIMPVYGVVLLKFLIIDLEYNWITSKCADWIEIYDGKNTSANVIQETLCGTNIPENITSSGNGMFIAFKSDHSKGGKFKFLIDTGEYVLW